MIRSFRHLLVGFAALASLSQTGLPHVRAGLITNQVAIDHIPELFALANSLIKESEL